MKYKSFLTGLFILFIFTSRVSLKAQARNLALKEAIELSLKNSKVLKNNALKIDMAAIDVTGALENRLPDAGTSVSYLYLPVKPNIDLKTGSNNNTNTKVHQVVYGNVSVSVPLYTAGKLTYGIESARYLEQAIKLDAEHERGLVILNTIYACINLYKADQAITLVRENLVQARQRVTDFSNLEKNGVLARNDLLKAELQAGNTELALLDAESNFKLACVNMNLMIGWTEQTEIVPDKTGIALPTEIKSLESYETDALQNRKDVVALTYRKKAAISGIRFAKSDYYPGIALTGGYLAADIPGFLSVTNTVNIGIGIKYNIASLWKTKTKIQEAKLKLQQLENNVEMLNDDIRLQINRAYQSYLVSVKKIQVFEKSVEQATENYRITKNKYDNALATVTELLEADVALLQSKLSVTNAKADSFLAYNKLLQVSGLLNN